MGASSAKLPVRRGRAKPQPLAGAQFSVCTERRESQCLLSFACPIATGDGMGLRDQSSQVWASRREPIISSPPWTSVFTLFLNLNACLLPKRNFIFSNCIIYRMEHIVAIIGEGKKAVRKSHFLKHHFLSLCCGLVWGLCICYYI